MNKEIIATMGINQESRKMVTERENKKSKVLLRNCFPVLNLNEDEVKIVYDYSMIECRLKYKYI